MPAGAQAAQAYWKAAIRAAKGKIDTDDPEGKRQHLAALEPLRQRYRVATRRVQDALPGPIKVK